MGQSDLSSSSLATLEAPSLMSRWRRKKTHAQLPFFHSTFFLKCEFLFDRLVRCGCCVLTCWRRRTWWRRTWWASPTPTLSSSTVSRWSRPALSTTPRCSLLTEFFCSIIVFVHILTNFDFGGCVQDPEWNFSYDFNVPDGDAKIFR